MNVKVKIDLTGLKAVKEDIEDGAIMGIERGSERFLEHMRDNHGPGSHSSQRFITRTGMLLQGTRIMPVAKEPDRITGGVISYPDHAAPIEEGHDIIRNGKKVGEAPAYPYMGPALDDDETVQKFMDTLAREVEKKLNG